MLFEPAIARFFSGIDFSAYHAVSAREAVLSEWDGTENGKSGSCGKNAEAGREATALLQKWDFSGIFGLSWLYLINTDLLEFEPNVR